MNNNNTGRVSPGPTTQKSTDQPPKRQRSRNGEAARSRNIAEENLEPNIRYIRNPDMKSDRTYQTRIFEPESHPVPRTKLLWGISHRKRPPQSKRNNPSNFSGWKEDE